MTRKTLIRLCTCLLMLAPALHLLGQEFTAPLRFNPVVNERSKAAGPKVAKKTTATLTLPFFEDFTGYSPYPDSNRWVDFEAYINNTMGVNPVSRGMATLDDLDQRGVPYDSFSNTTFRFADSLTSQLIDLGGSVSSDSIYLSFFYQPQGNAYYPLVQDSLNLYMRNRFGDFVLVWSVPGSALQPFQQVMIPITDSLYFHSSFQFRFVNIAALYWSDADWNIDYIRLDKNRNINDTAVNDVGFTSNPTFYLNDYTSMPYRQFFANTAVEISALFRDSLHNNYDTAIQVSYGYSSVDIGSGSILHASSLSMTTIPGSSFLQLTYPAFTTVVAPPSAEGKVVFENTFFIQPVSPTDPTGNDTIVSHQVFDNYLAYDDGSAEKSYYLNLFPTLPGKIAIEYHLNTSDTLRGLGIYFGRQIPFPGYKSFSIIVYSALQGVNGATSDHVLYQQDLYSPAYGDSVNHYYVYSFDTPLVLPAGTFYAGTMQPAASASDSLYIGLDVNRLGGNHAYYNVVGVWSPSLISGAIMMRPMLGQSLDYLHVKNPAIPGQDWTIIPNPATDRIRFEFNSDSRPTFAISDVSGRNVITGTATSGESIDIGGLQPGIYFVNLYLDGRYYPSRKLIKM